ncbi:multicopper oxidase family protein [Boseongicola aestuarii]|uniref:Copper resistance protein A n=1 Tax=Boseongicola aestuarii TaxID=1470561 RepID=A0A238J024_9RHOB|nr:multicopper oxidase family protein [Boseongicola aestuarii]SMX23592.1 Copper resistance protein A precursor [Boseongicola aestuarii]
MMKLTRRTLLSTAAAAFAMPRHALATPSVLRAEAVSLQVLPAGQNATALWGFNGSSPGPELRVRQGDTLALRFENRTEQPSSVHWHGIRLENAMDGVPGLTQPLVQPGETFDYTFKVPDAGTFWYHSHHQSWEQVARGLYGPLIVDEIDPPEVDADITVTLDDWRLDENGAIMGGFGNMHDFSHAGRLGNYAMILPSQENVRLGDRVRLRLINTATARVFPIRIEGLNAKVVALDGMPLAEPRDLSDIQIAPAQRVDIIGDVTAQVDFLFVARDELYEMGSLSIAGENPDPARSNISGLPATNLPYPAETPDHNLTLRMEGGAMGGRHAGDDIWAFNGVSGLKSAPFAKIKRGETAIIEIINDTSFPHGIHLHGHHFHELSDDGSMGDFRDTSLVERGAIRKIVAVFDNPGKWLLHCHMLEHQASGMKTWIEVT